MKNLMIAIALMFVSQTIDAQTTNLPGCFGLNFGCSRQEVKDMMRLKHPEAEILKDDQKSLGYSGGTWAGRDAYIWIFAFTSDGKLHTATVSMKPDKESGIWTLYDDVCQDLTDKYGSEKIDNEDWLYPYTSKDKYTYGVSALKMGKVTIYKTWVFANDTPTDDDDNALQIKISDGVYVTVKYQDGVLIQDVVRQNSEKRKSDM